MQIHQVKGRHVNSYIIEGTDGLAVVDVAYRGEKYVLGYIREVMGRQPADVSLVLCTHGDPDHGGGLRQLAAACNAMIAVPYATGSTRRKLLNDPTGIFYRLVTSLIEGLRPRAWAMYASPHRDTAARLLPTYEVLQDSHSHQFNGKPDFRLKHGHHLPGFPEWRVIHTPGHSWDSCCYLHESKGVLISGDTLLGSGKKNQLVTPSVLSNPAQMKQTIKTLQSLTLTAVYPGHGHILEGRHLLDHL